MRKVEITINPALNQAVGEFLKQSEKKASKASVETAVAEYVDAKRAIERLEAVMKLHRPVIEEALQASGGKAEIAGHKLTLVQFEKESFSLSEAKEKLDLRMLRPFIKKSDVTQIRVGRTL